VPPSRDDEPSHGLSDAEEERAWQAIIAGFDGPAVDPHPPVRPDPADRPDFGDGGRLPGPHYRPGDPEPADTGDWFGEPPPPVRPGPERDDLIVDPWSDVETGRRGRRRTRGGPADADALPSGKDLDKAAESRARHEQEAAREDSEDLWIDGPPTLDSSNEEHFEPPPPPPLPRPSRNTVLAVLLVVIGVLLIAVPQLIGMDDRSGLTLGVLAVLAGAVLLVLRLREARDEDGPDDGAVV
jgi:hypothetical protein